MYINPFLAGVLATIFIEITSLFVISVCIIVKRGKYDGRH